MNLIFISSYIRIRDHSGSLYSGLVMDENERLGNGKNISVFLIIEGFAHIIISLVSEQNSVLFGLSMQQILSFVL